jgi:NAD+ synthase (glutamine-hydrolysing)
MARQLRVVMAQINLLVGDIAGNTQLAIEAARCAISEHEADIIAFPELTATGYPPEDLLLRPSMALRVQRALDEICAAGLDIHIIFGHPLLESGRIYNALAVIRNGEVLAYYRKQYLPNYRVFDERRYFASGSDCCLIEINDIKVGVTICEDMWEPEPTRQAKEAGAELLININASPFHIEKLAQRLRLLHDRASVHQLPIIYVNLIGGQDELVFDGASMAVGADGKCMVLGPSFTTALIPVLVREGQSSDLPLNETGAASLRSAPPPLQLTLQLSGECSSAPGSVEESVYRALTLGLHDYVLKNGFRKVVLGLSGGIDSALTLSIAVDALGADRVQAVMMPFEYTSRMSIELAESQARRLGVHYSVIPISDAYQAFTGSLEEEFGDLPADVTEQNIQARCRGVLLMAISNKKGSLVLTTGNKSEIAVGYSTLYGDMAGGFDVLKDVAKTLVYRLADYRNSLPDALDAPVIPRQVIERAPSAELAPGQVDQDNLPPYPELDEILRLYVEEDQSASAIIAHGFAEETVRRVLRLVDINEYKRRQSPVGVRITQRGFGRDRRYPITSGWELGD